jgi:hypothetical protein
MGIEKKRGTKKITGILNLKWAYFCNMTDKSYVLWPGRKYNDI